MAKRNFKSPRYAASAPTSSQLVAFNEIESGVNKGKLLFRLIHSWEARNPSKGGLLIGLELLLIDEKANLYEFYKFNRESGGEIYFTMPRLQSFTIQCLEALQFLRGLGLIHCDLKPENISVKSYSRCEIKVLDLGSSCFETDHLCSYVQSRSYRAPEVILGLPYV